MNGLVIGKTRHRLLTQATYQVSSWSCSMWGVDAQKGQASSFFPPSSGTFEPKSGFKETIEPIRIFSLLDLGWFVSLYIKH